MREEQAAAVGQAHEPLPCRASERALAKSAARLLPVERRGKELRGPGRAVVGEHRDWHGDAAVAGRRRHGSFVLAALLAVAERALGTKSRAAAMPVSTSPNAAPRTSITRRVAPLLVSAATSFLI